MKIIKVNSGSSHLSQLLLRQTPRSSGVWQECNFKVNQNVPNCDAWFVLHHSGLQYGQHSVCDPSKIFYISMEPSEKIGNVSNSFLDQFSCVVTTDINVRHSNVIHANFHTWWAGINVAHKNNKHLFSSCVNLDYDDFISQMYSLNNKLSRICCIVSNKSFLPGHVNRLDMVKELINSPVGQYIDLYGSIGQPFSDKYQVQSRYKYSLVLENTILPHYWSEKLADSFLARSYPFYLGCPNIEKYFDEDSMTIINDMTPPQVSEAILKALDADLFSQKVTSIFSSMRKVLDEYNIFNQMARLSIGPTSGRKHIMLKPNIYFVENRLERFRRKLSLAKRFATRSL